MTLATLATGGTFHSLKRSYEYCKKSKAQGYRMCKCLHFPYSVHIRENSRSKVLNICRLHVKSCSIRDGRITICIITVSSRLKSELWIADHLKALDVRLLNSKVHTWLV